MDYGCYILTFISACLLYLETTTGIDRRMKINIGPYKEWIGPYQIAEKLFFWMGDDKQHKIGTWLSKDKDGNDSYLNKFCKWIDSKKHRKIEVKIDGYDVWSMDQTLAYIISHWRAAWFMSCTKACSSITRAGWGRYSNSSW